MLGLPEERALRVDPQLLVQHPRQQRADVLDRHRDLAAEPRQRLGQQQQRLVRARRHARLRLRTQVLLLVERAVLVAHVRHPPPGDVQRVLVLVLDARPTRGRRSRAARAKKPSASSTSSGTGSARSSLPIRSSSASDSTMSARRRLGRPAGVADPRRERVEQPAAVRRTAHRRVDPIAQRLDHLERPAAEVIVGRQVPRRRPDLDHLLEHLGVALGHQRQQRRLRLGRDPVVLVDHLHPVGQPAPPSHAHLVGRHRLDQLARQRAPQQVRHRQLRMPALHHPPHLGRRITDQHRHQHRDRRLAAPRATDDQQPLSGQQREQRQQQKRTPALAGMQRHPCPAADAARRAELDIVVRRHQRMRRDPLVRSRQLLHQRQSAPLAEHHLAVRGDPRPALQPARDPFLRKRHPERSSLALRGAVGRARTREA